MAAEALTATEYIKHHMAHLASAHQGSVVDFSIVNYDTIFFSVLMLAVMFFLLRAGAKTRRKKSYVRCPRQNAVRR